MNNPRASATLYYPLKHPIFENSAVSTELSNRETMILLILLVASASFEIGLAAEGGYKFSINLYKMIGNIFYNHQSKTQEL